MINVEKSKALKHWLKNGKKQSKKKVKIAPFHFAKMQEYKDALIQRATEHEKIFMEILEYYNIEYVFQKMFISDKVSCIADFYLPKYNLVIEIDGLYHKYVKSQRIRDNIKDRFYISRGKNILRLTNEQLDSFNVLMLLPYIRIKRWYAK